MKIIHTEKYKNHRIEVYEQKPNVKIPITDKDFEKHFNRSDLNEVLGTHAYSVFDKTIKLYGVTIAICGILKRVLTMPVKMWIV